MQIFGLRDQLIHDYTAYTASFIQIKDEKIRAQVEQNMRAGLLWPVMFQFGIWPFLYRTAEFHAVHI